jgi:hypothetical protein
MRKIILAIAVLSLVLLSSGAYADDINFAPPHWGWYLQDYPRWHYQDDYGLDGTAQFWQQINYVQLELEYSQNTLVETVILHMMFTIDIYDGEGDLYYYFYFDIPPGVTSQIVQFPLHMYSWSERYELRELNTIPEGGGWVVIDFENSWLDVFTDDAVMMESLGKLKGGYE